MSTLLLLPGDGIGPEVCAEVRRVAAALTPDLKVEEAPYGGMSYDAHGTPLLDEVRDQAIASDAVLMGAVGGPKWADAPRHLRPEAGLLNLRKAMDVYANLRPAYCFEALAGASSLKTELVSGLDIMFVRELVGGLNKLIAYAQLTGQEVSLQLAEEQLTDILSANRRRITIDEIQRTVC